MNTDPNTFEPWTDDQFREGKPDRCDERPVVELRSVVVNYEQRPDRRTVYPHGLSSIERTSTWFSADDDAFVDLETVR